MASNRELSTVGRTLAAVQDDLLQQRARPSVSVQIAAIYQARARRRRARQRLSRLAYCAGAAAIAMAVMLLVTRPRALEFHVNEEADVGQLGVLIASPNSGEQSLGFSDGSKIRLRGGAQARVVSSTERGARIVIERGTVRADVVPRPKNDWSLFGGPFEIHVTGTSFDSSWDPERQQLFVQMHEGHVLISAECLKGKRALSAGQSGTFSCLLEPSPTLTRSDSVVPPSSAVPARLPELSSPLPLPATQSVVPGAVQTPVQRAPSWRELSALGEYASAFALAQREGFERLCETLSTAELLELANTARLAGNAGAAKAGYAAVRRRFPGSESAAGAAFHLGQLAFDTEHDYGTARRSFASYLEECQNCTLAAEALGRRMEAERRLGKLDLARSSARLYIDRFPGGAHARLAESLIGP